MFKSKRKFEGDIGCEWAKDDTLDKRLEELPEYCDFIAVRHWLFKCGSTPCFEMYIYAKMPNDNGLIPVKGCAY